MNNNNPILNLYYLFKRKGVNNIELTYTDYTRINIIEDEEAGEARIIDLTNYNKQTLAGSCGEILYAIQKPTVKYFIEEYEEKFELDYVEYFAILLEENKRINMRMAFSNYRDNTVCYF